MTNEFPLVSIVIPVHPAKVEVKAADSSRQLDYPREKLEIIIVRSTDLSTVPAMKRNAAIKAARGELIYFLDDDSVPLPGNLRRAVARFSDPQVMMVGGPNVCPSDAPTLERSLGLAMGSWVAFGPSCARYRAFGRLRASSEKELISCNLMARRQPLLELGSFDERMYPNEENALMDGMQKRGRLLYDPELIVYRRPRSTLSAFMKMLLFYGRGRAEQFRLHPSFASAPNFVPPAFCLYLASLAFVPALTSIGMAYFLPLALYGLVVLGQAASVGVRSGFAWGLRVLPLIAMTNVLYGLGFWHGLVTRIAPLKPGQGTDIRLETVPA